MVNEEEMGRTTEPAVQPAAPIFPTSSVEFVNALSHYYRGEMARMTSWRDRIDRTTNWAIAAVAAMLSVSLSSPTSHHGVLLFAMLLVFLLLVIESRRYRFFDVYRSRVRLLERNYYARIFAKREIDPAKWMDRLGHDLYTPHFSITMGNALARRLRRSYIWLFLILLLAWFFKTTQTTLVTQAGESVFVLSWRSLFQNAALGHLPAWGVLLGLTLFYGWMIYIMLIHRQSPGELAYGEVHV